MRGAATQPKTSTERYDWINLQSDLAGVARNVDSNLVNPWGIAPHGLFRSIFPAP